MKYLILPEIDSKMKQTGKYKVFCTDNDKVLFIGSREDCHKTRIKYIATEKNIKNDIQ